MTAVKATELFRIVTNKRRTAHRNLFVKSRDGATNENSHLVSEK
jgi:hypothetical protein